MAAVGTIVNTVFCFFAILVAKRAIGATFSMPGILHAFKCIAKNTAGLFFTGFSQLNRTFFSDTIVCSFEVTGAYVILKMEQKVFGCSV